MVSMTMVIVGFVPVQESGCGTPFQMAVSTSWLRNGGKPHPNHLDSNWDDPPSKVGWFENHPATWNGRMV